MSYPAVADLKPVGVELEAGKEYYFCTCGLSKNQPFCDGAHRKENTGMKPLKFAPEQSGEAWLCMCKQTKTPPYCDGSHTELRKAKERRDKIVKYAGLAAITAVLAAIFLKKK
ncbi:AgCISD_1 putative mitochondrial CDGSH iron-sulfur domain-containing protein [Andalucia godoyi]|uniref:AgCISD_1 putative mitochondrial CDGSH iron-sulfur domain-containing protein n=1 Tax=Andalucia godoyi TaxID=505711 RepID=A0A8K0AH38_ANDGO|nr:AgCISD_1 putative mitochondrial CDGSH iron-sulfur domain-containing protein [Andalucia godoyi]|eukprot:ANDGO_04129.mRNA.1 AgCISD_1 putative mitochondrial CDGSH iron-sulfur domain-containing protein